MRRVKVERLQSIFSSVAADTPGVGPRSSARTAAPISFRIMLPLPHKSRPRCSLVAIGKTAKPFVSIVDRVQRGLDLRAVGRAVAPAVIARQIALGADGAACLADGTAHIFHETDAAHRGRRNRCAEPDD